MLAVIALVASEVRRWRGARIATKVLASVGFVVTGMAMATPGDSYARAILIGLVLGALGDVALLGRSTRAFVTGLVLFLGGHIAYVVAFLPHSQASHFSALAFGAVALTGIFAFARRAGKLGPAVTVYSLVIATMVAVAEGVEGDHFLHVGVVLFAASDVAVARERFVQSHPVNRVVGLPLYYAGQLLIAWTLA